MGCRIDQLGAAQLSGAQRSSVGRGVAQLRNGKLLWVQRSWGGGGGCGRRPTLGPIQENPDAGIKQSRALPKHQQEFTSEAASNLKTVPVRAPDILFYKVVVYLESL